MDGHAADILVDVLKDEYPGSAIGLIGCYASGEEYPCCEYDFLIVSNTKSRYERRVIGNKFVDLLFIDESSLDSADELFALALIDIIVATDPKWLLTPFVSRFKAESANYLHKFAKHTMFKSLLKLGRFRDAFDKVNNLAAGFWLSTSAYDFASALVAYYGSVPHTSHLLFQFRKTNLSTDIFELWSKVLSLNLATQVTVTRRLDVLRDILTSGLGILDSSMFPNPSYSYKLAETRIKFLIKSHSIVDAYFYLGYELANIIEKLYELKCKRFGKIPAYHDIINHLVSSKPNVGMSTQSFRLMGITKDEHILQKQGSSFNNLVKNLAKNICKK